MNLKQWWKARRCRRWAEKARRPLVRLTLKEDMPPLGPEGEAWLKRVEEELNHYVEQQLEDIFQTLIYGHSVRVETEGTQITPEMLKETIREIKAAEPRYGRSPAQVAYEEFMRSQEERRLKEQEEQRFEQLAKENLERGRAQHGNWRIGSNPGVDFSGVRNSDKAPWPATPSGWNTSGPWWMQDLKDEI